MDVKVARKLELIVAVAGHRWDRIDRRHEPRLAEAVAACLAGIDRAAMGVSVSMLTGLAEGADQVAASVMPPQWGLIAVLPMLREDYERHLLEHSTGDPAEAIGRLRRLLRRRGVRVIDANLGSPEAGYLSIQSQILKAADLMLVIWDGEASAGQGGTTDTVVRALAREIPVLWIHTDQDRVPALQRVTAASDQGAEISEILKPSEMEKLVAGLVVE